IFFVEQQARVSESDRDVAIRGDGSEKLNIDEKRILVVALKGERFAFRALDFLDHQVGMKFHAHVAGGFDGGEIDFRRCGKRLPDGVKRRGDVVVGGEKIRGARDLSMERRRGDERKSQRKQTDSAGNSSTAGHRTPFNAIQYPNPMYT